MALALRSLAILALAGCGVAVDEAAPVSSRTAEAGEPALELPMSYEDLEALARDPAGRPALAGEELRAFELLRRADPMMGGGRFFVTSDGEGGIREPLDALQAVWTLLDAERPDAAFAALFSESPPGSEGRLGALIGLRTVAPEVFAAGARHAEASGESFAVLPYWAPGYGCLVPTSLSTEAAVREYADGLRVQKWKEQWERQGKRER